ncbi:hypothetical protein H4582DRAFT_124653 [Lactarius indigo]|nr:hypothetical protein H4582DRAFT_124653 [Lactarius indigo]
MSPTAFAPIGPFSLPLSLGRAATEGAEIALFTDVDAAVSALPANPCEKARARSCAISAKFCPPNVTALSACLSDERGGRREQVEKHQIAHGGSQSVLFTHRMLVSAMHRSAPGVQFLFMHLRTRISLRGQCLECLLAVRPVRYQPALSDPHVHVYVRRL